MESTDRITKPRWGAIRCRSNGIACWGDDIVDSPAELALRGKISEFPFKGFIKDGRQKGVQFRGGLSL